MVVILTILNLLCLSILLTGVFRGAGAIKISILTVTVFSFLYVIVSGLFFWIDTFSFVHVLGTILILTASLAAFLIGKETISSKQIFYYNLVHHLDRNQSHELHGTHQAVHGSGLGPGETPVPTIEIVLIVLSFLLSFQNFELYSTGQDQGIYQAEAIELYMGNYEVEHDYEEYQILESEEDKAAYLSMLRTGIIGYYPISGYYRRIGFMMSEPISDVSGMYHGIQTFPAILALGGKLFGLENMLQVQTIFLICSVLLLYYSLCNIKVPTPKALGVLTIFLLSPLVLWISKTAFTEMILTLCMSFYLFLLTEANTRVKRFLLALPLVAFSFIHVSFLIIFPIFVFINVLLFFQSGQKEYIWGNLIASAGLAAGYTMMAHIGPQYFFDNISRLYYKNIITTNNFLYWCFLGCFLVSICSLLLLYVKDLNALFQKIVKICKASPILAGILVAINIFHVVIIGYFRTPEDGWRTNLCLYYGEGFFNAFSHSTLFAFAMATGFLVMLCALWYVVRYHKSIWSTPTEIAIYFLFLYCILFQSAFIRKEVNYYYYYSRYLVFNIPIICIVFAFLFKRTMGRGLWSALALSFIFMLIFDVPLLREKDQTYLEWENLLDLEMAIQDDSAIILGPNVTRLLGATVRAVSGQAAFPVMSDPQSEIKLLEDHYSTVYYLSSEMPLSAVQTLDGADLEIVYRDRYLYQDTVSLKGYFPLKYTTVERELILYEIKRPVFDYTLNSKPQDYEIYGFSGAELKGRWTSEKEAAVVCHLPKEAYHMTVDVASVPLGSLNLDSYTASVHINDNYLGDITITPDSQGGAYQFAIPKEYMCNGSNTLSFNCEQLWSPSNYGSSDSRILGIFVEHIKFVPVD